MIGEVLLGNFNVTKQYWPLTSTDEYCWLMDKQVSKSPKEVTVPENSPGDKNDELESKTGQQKQGIENQ